VYEEMEVAALLVLLSEEECDECDECDEWVEVLGLLPWREE
jgi:hypothetical protein